MRGAQRGADVPGADGPPQRRRHPCHLPHARAGDANLCCRARAAQVRMPLPLAPLALASGIRPLPSRHWLSPRERVPFPYPDWPSSREYAPSADAANMYCRDSAGTTARRTAS
eukprot:6390077-Pyramimonas_sp.AAC.2